MRGILSHPGVALVDHLQKVADGSSTIIGKKNLTVEIDKKIVQDLAYLSGASHDIAKATSFFIYYLQHHEINGPKNHALLSAILAKELAQLYLQDKEVSEFDKKILPYLIFTSVKRHHGNLQNFEKELFIEDKSAELVQQINSFDDGKVQEMLDQLLSKINVSYDWKQFKNYIQSKSFEEELPDFCFEEFNSAYYESLPVNAQVRYFYLHQLLYSTLLYADKSDVIVKHTRKEVDHAVFEAIEKYRKKKGFDKPTTDLDRLKNQSYQEAIQNIYQVFDPKQHFYSITLPTGLGKTITSLAVGMEMKKLLKANDTKLVITIPFTSIIDQNYAVFEDIFDKPSSDFLLKHHHLSEPKYKTEEEEFDAGKSQFLIETWNSEIVVTTFVQLLETLFTNDKSKLLKLPNLTNAIIILDEIQQINYKLWSLIRQAFDTVGKQFNCYFVLMSATQPLIFTPVEEIIEIIPNHKQYFHFFNRTKIINRTREEISMEEFTQLVIDYILENSTKDVLIILNTKKYTLDCFKNIVACLDEDLTDAYYLSTLITPFERKKIISLIKNKPTKRQQIIVSTQLIEAGVDVSVDTIFRALAPLDSIIQAAGRANRYGEKEGVSEVFLYQIAEMKKDSAKIYGADLMQKTKNVLKDIIEISENEYLRLIEAYFREVKKQADVIDSEELEAMCFLKFGDIGKFALIEERNTESVFLQLNQEAKQLWNTYEAIYNNKATEIFQKREAFAQIKSRFYDYVVNVPIPYGKSAIEFEGEITFNFYVSKIESPSQFYHYNEGNLRENFGYVPRSQVSC